MNRGDSVFCASVILPNSKRIECRLPESPREGYYTVTIIIYTVMFV